MARSALGGCRVLFGAVALLTIAAQFVHGSGEPDFSAVEFFSYFTIESNLFAGVLLILVGVRTLRGGEIGSLAAWRGAAVLYMSTTGLVYLVMLSGQQSETLVWVNAILHYVMPPLVLADWIVDPPGRRIPYERAVAWMAFPVAFIAYSLIRGAIVDWYPYPFVDVNEHGYLGVAIASVVIGAGMLGLALLLARSAERRSLLPPVQG